MFRCFCVCVCTSHSDFTAVFLTSRVILKSTRTPNSTLTSSNHLRNAACRVAEQNTKLHNTPYICAHRLKLYIEEMSNNFNIVFWKKYKKIKIYAPWREKVDLWGLCVCVFKFQILKRWRILQNVVWTFSNWTSPKIFTSLQSVITKFMNLGKWPTRCTVLFYVFIYIFNSLHVSSTSCSSLGETNCVNTTSGSCHSVSVAVSCACLRLAHDTATDGYQRLYRHSLSLLMMSTMCSKHVES